MAIWLRRILYPIIGRFVWKRLVRRYGPRRLRRT